MTNPNDLIRRGDALALNTYDGDGDPAGPWDHHVFVLRSEINAIPAAPEVLALVEALDNLLEAITAENKFRDRSLTITGPIVNIKRLFEAEDEARAAIAAWDKPKIPAKD